MNTKPITPGLHSAIDYSFALGLFVLPRLLNVETENKRIYDLFTKSIVVFTAFTDQPLSIKRVIPFKVHGAIDYLSLLLLYSLLLKKSFRKDKAALYIQTGFVILGTLNVLLTNYSANSKAFPKAE